MGCIHFWSLQMKFIFWRRKINSVRKFQLVIIKRVGLEANAEETE
jgi:hypothetical protein